MAFILGITGGIGSGKSAATQWFESQGIQVVDADIVAREVVEKGNLPFKKFNKPLEIGCFNPMAVWTAVPYVNIFFKIHKRVIHRANYPSRNPSIYYSTATKS